MGLYFHSWSLTVYSRCFISSHSESILSRVVHRGTRVSKSSRVAREDGICNRRKEQGEQSSVTRYYDPSGPVNLQTFLSTRDRMCQADGGHCSSEVGCSVRDGETSRQQCIN